MLLHVIAKKHLSEHEASEKKLARIINTLFLYGFCSAVIREHWIFPRCHMWHVFLFFCFCKWVRDKWKFLEFWSAVCWLKSRSYYNSRFESWKSKTSIPRWYERRWNIKGRFNTSKWAWIYKLVFNFHVFFLSQVSAKFFFTFFSSFLVWVESKQSKNRAVVVLFFNLWVSLCIKMSKQKLEFKALYGMKSMKNMWQMNINFN